LQYFFNPYLCGAFVPMVLARAKEYNFYNTRDSP